jgi:LPS sulfotransferase NodH
MKPNFVIFSEPRTGSTALTSALDYQKDIFCLKEIFKDKNLYINIKYLNKLDQNNKIENLLGLDYSKWEQNRDERFKDFLDLLSNLSDKKIFGYKFFEKHFASFQDHEVYLNFLKENHTKIIILERKNVLLRYISHLTAQSIGVYSSKINNEHSEKIFQLNPIEIDYKEYIKYNKKIERQFRDKLKAVQDYGLEHINITYEDFVGEKFIECFKKIFDFLDLNFENFIDPRNNGGMIGNHKKVNIYRIEDKILNYEAFKKAAEENNDIETLNFLKDNE